MDNITTGLITTGVVGSASFLLNVYIGQKLKNVANEEDVKEITKAVENVKFYFQKDIEKLKQELSILTNKHNILFTEEKEALVAYLSAWNIWFGVLKIIWSQHDISQYDIMVNLIRKFNDEYDNVQVSMSKLDLFLNSQDIVLAAYNLNVKTYKIQSLNEKAVKAMYLIYQNGTKQEEIVKVIEEHKAEFASIINNVLIAKTNFVELGKKYIRKDIVG